MSEAIFWSQMHVIGVYVLSLVIMALGEELVGRAMQSRKYG